MSTEPVGSQTSEVVQHHRTAGPCTGDAGGGEHDLSLARVLPVRDLAAIVLAGTGALLVFISLLVDWQGITIPGTAEIRVGIADIPTWGTVYVLSSMALIAIFVCVVALPVRCGPSTRVLGISCSMGVAAIIVSMLVRLTDVPAVGEGGVLQRMVDGSVGSANVHVSWGWGIVYAALAVAALMGAFITACPPLRGSEVS